MRLNRVDLIGAWLGERLRHGAMVKADVLIEARKIGFAERTVLRARKRIGAITEISGFGPEKQAIWWLPHL